MPGATSHGYPYPLGTDRVADGDNAIHDLAQKVNDQLGAMASGLANVTITAIDTVANVSVTLPVGRFLSAPQVVATSFGGTTPGYASTTYSISSASATGFTLNAYRRAGGTGAQQVAWIASQI